MFVGDWEISIMYHEQHISGSPFSVRVYDAEAVQVFGLEQQGDAGQAYGFTGMNFKSNNICGESILFQIMLLEFLYFF